MKDESLPRAWCSNSCCVHGNETELAAEGSRGHCLEVHSTTWHSLPTPHQLEPTQANSVAKASPFLHDHQSPVSGAGEPQLRPDREAVGELLFPVGIGRVRAYQGERTCLCSHFSICRTREEPRWGYHGSLTCHPGASEKCLRGLAIVCLEEDRKMLTCDSSRSLDSGSYRQKP